MAPALRMTLSDDYESGIRAIYETARPIVIAHCWACEVTCIGRTDVEAVERLEAHLMARHPQWRKA
jgi:hypothetical protein